MPAYIELTKGKRAIVDECLFVALSHFKWWAHKGRNSYYAACHEVTPDGRKIRSMHAIVLQLYGIHCQHQIDHKDGNGLNNQRDNLRPATLKQNAANRRLHRDSTSGFKGVHFNKKRQRWEASITKDGHRRWLGFHDTAEEAAAAYDRAAIALHGEFARTNEDMRRSVAG